MAEQSTSIGRWGDLDRVRIAAIGRLIPYHVGGLGVPWNYPSRKKYPSQRRLEPFTPARNPWPMGLLFAVSGTATRCIAAGPRLGAPCGGPRHTDPQPCGASWPGTPLPH